jgi:serine/threonine protein kinase
MASQTPKPQIQPCRYKTGKTLGAGSYSVVKECVHIDTGRYYAAKVINKRLMVGREHMVITPLLLGMLFMVMTGGADATLKVRNEIEVLKRVSMGHQNILTLVDYFETMNNRTWNTCGITPFDVHPPVIRIVLKLSCSLLPTQSIWSPSSLLAESCLIESAAKAVITSRTPRILSAPHSPQSPIYMIMGSSTET